MLIVVNDADSCFCAESSTVSSPDTESATSAVTPADKVKKSEFILQDVSFSAGVR